MNRCSHPRYTATACPRRINMESTYLLPFHPNGMTFKSLNGNGKAYRRMDQAQCGRRCTGRRRTWQRCYPRHIQHEQNEWNSVLVLNVTQLMGRCSAMWRRRYLGLSGWSMENHERIHRTRLGPGRSITRSAELTQKGFTYYIKAKGYKDNLRSRGLVFSYAILLWAGRKRFGRKKIVTVPTCVSSEVPQYFITYRKAVTLAIPAFWEHLPQQD